VALSNYLTRWFDAICAVINLPVSVSNTTQSCARTQRGNLEKGGEMKSITTRGGVALLLFIVMLSAVVTVGQPTTWAQSATPTPVEAAAEADETVVTTGQPTYTVPFLAEWLASPHADLTAEAFLHWNEEEPPEVPANCARCHSTPGYQDYLGADGTAAGVVDRAHPTGTVVECAACHNPVASSLISVTFPSSATVAVNDPSARCMVCHQGRASTVQVQAAIERAGLTDQPDTPSADLGFVNIHYYAAAASLYGSEAHGGFEFPDQSYQPKFDHVAGYQSCADCHNPHTLEVKVEECATCHDGVTSIEELRDVRMQGSLRDYDGDGDLEEGIFYEIEGLREQLYQAIQLYAGETLTQSIVYDPATYPYFFIDTNANGVADEEEINGDNRYNSWTPRLLQAAYNYQTSLKDPGAFAHNAKYHIQLLFDSIEVLNEQLAEPVDLAQAQRNDAGHFDPTQEAFHRFLTDDEVLTPAGCAKCHSAGGLPFTLENQVTVAMPSTGGLQCTTCHQELQEFTLRPVAEVTFPSGATVSFEEDEAASNLCLNCHQGRESSFSINAAIIRAAVGDDEVSEELRFVNPHYFAAGATLFGGEVSGAYQYEGQSYVGRNEHVGRYNTCAECHNVHALTVQTAECADCHEYEELSEIRDEDDEIDWDGDGDVTEGIASEIGTIHEALLTAIYTYAADTLGAPLVYAPANYPYWYNDTNANGEADADEINRDNQYASWTPTLLRAAYNYQYVSKDPGAFAHNSRYVLQVLQDSLAAIGGEEAVAGMTRPEAEE
jgi:hypothetical protein